MSYIDLTLDDDDDNVDELVMRLDWTANARGNVPTEKNDLVNSFAMRHYSEAITSTDLSHQELKKSFTNISSNAELRAIDDELAILLGMQEMKISEREKTEMTPKKDYRSSMLDMVHERMEESTRPFVLKRPPVIGEATCLDDVISDWNDVREVQAVFEAKKMATFSQVAENRIRELAHCSDSVLVTDANSVRVDGNSIKTLRRGVWLNDAVINSYMKLLINRSKHNCENASLPMKYRLKCYFQKSFFYTKLVYDNQGYHYNNVRRWSKKAKVIITDLDRLFVPVHVHGNHWCLAVVNFTDKRLEYYDSLRGRNEACLENLRRYVSDEAATYSDNPNYDWTGWTTWHATHSPRQTNGCDCGVFTVKTADYLSESLDLNFTQGDMNYFRRRMMYEIATANVL